MRPALRRSGIAAVLATLVAIPTGLPAVAQSSGPAPQITQQHSILTELSNTGEVRSSRVFTQLTVNGRGQTDVVLPAQSTQGLRSLDAFRGPDVNGDEVVWSLDATPAGAHARTVADNTSDLPVEVTVRYQLDGREVTPEELIGRSGRLQVTYTVTNLTTEPTEIRTSDVRGNYETETVDAAVPMVGSLAVTLPPTFTRVDARGANVAGDGRGNTVVNFSLLLFAPLGDEVQEVSYVAEVVDARVPGARVQVLPVDESSFTSLRNTSLAYRDAVDGTQALGYGAQLIDANVLKLADGAAQLLDGLTQLSDGASQLSDGLGGTAAPGARQLADGTGQARSGAGQLATGLNELSLGANRLSAGASTLNSSTGELVDGAGELAVGAAAFQDGINDLADGVLGSGGLFDAVLGGIEKVRDGAVPILSAGPAPTTNPTLLDGLTLLAGTPRTTDAAPTGLLAAAEGAGALNQISAGLYNAYRVSRGGLVAAVFSTGPAAATPCDVDADPSEDNPCSVDDFFVAVAGEIAPDALPAQQYIGRGRALLGQVNTGLSSSLTSLGADPGSLPTAYAQCDAVLGAVLAGTATGLQSLLAASCISLALDTGINGDGGDNPGAAAAAARLRDGARDLGLGLDAGLDDFAAQVRQGEARLEGAFGAPGTSETLLDGAARIAGGTDALADGAARLRREGTSALADGAGQLADGAGQAAGGGRDLANGLTQIDDGANQLADGLGDAADGSQQLADGLEQAEDGGSQIADGSVRLSEEGMGALIDGIGDAKRGASRNLGSIQAVSQRGRSYEGPYGVADRAAASTVWQFDLAGVGVDEGGPSTTTVALLALLAFGAAGAAGLGLRRRLA